MRNLITFLALILVCVISANAQIIEVRDFENAEQEERFNSLSAQLRCPMCLNAPLSQSDAPIAADLRAEIYQQIMNGCSNEEIITFMTQRYGDFINYRPPLNPGTYLLWFGPLVLLLAGFFVVWRMGKNSQLQKTVELTAEEKQKLDTLLAEKNTEQG